MQKSPVQKLLAALVVILLAVLGWWIVRGAQVETGTTSRSRPTAPARPGLVDTPNTSPKRPDRHSAKSGRDALLDALLSVKNERIVRFKTDQDYQRFLAGLQGSGLRLLGKIDRFRAARIGYDDLSDLDELLGDDDESYGNYYVSIPELSDVGAQAGALAFGSSTLEWLGVTGDNSAFGAGVKIAILDTGVGTHAAFPNGITEINLLRSEEPVPLNGHGTAVASLIAGVDRTSPGLAPGAELLSVRIGDENGESNSFLLAEGIVAAVDAGSQLINISMGSYGDSALVRDAVSYANENGVLLIASSGNEGLDGAAFPAAYDNVISVGANDAKSDYLQFSNQEVDLTAPGYSVAAAWPGETGDDYVYFTGTSASAPLVTAAIAATMTTEALPASNAYDLVVENLNEAGIAGTDPLYGDGILNVGRTQSSDEAGIYDAATASHVFTPATDADPSNRVEVTVENRGTELITNARVDISVSDGTFTSTVPRIAPGEYKTVTIPVTLPTTTEQIVIRSDISIFGNITDRNPSNDGLATQISLLPPAEPES